MASASTSNAGSAVLSVAKAGISRLWNGRDEDRWIELGKLGLEGTLLKSGMAQMEAKRIAKLLQQPEEGEESKRAYEELKSFLGNEDAMCVLLATLGRDSRIYAADTARPVGNVTFSWHGLRIDYVYFIERQLRQRELTALCVNLARNPKIKQLSFVIKLQRMPTNDDHAKAAEALANALRENSSLEAFRIEVDSRRAPRNPQWNSVQTWVQTLLAAFVHKQEGTLNKQHLHSGSNRAIRHLVMNDIPKTAESVNTLCEVLRTNKTLKSVDLLYCAFDPDQWGTILAALHHNGILQELELTGSSGLVEGDVLDQLMDLLRFTSTGLNVITLKETNLQHKQVKIDEELRVNREYRTSLASAEKVAPRSGRIVLCGYPYAGKTSICNTWAKKDTRHPQWKRFLQSHPRFRQLVYGRNVHLEIQHRTRGLDITIRGRGTPPRYTTIWDFGGQEEYYVLHDYVFPNAGNSCFLYICSAVHQPNKSSGYQIPKEEEYIREEFRFWMRFIASNFKHLKAEDGRAHRPSVTFVLTHLDCLKPEKHSDFRSLTQQIVADFRTVESFGAFLDISENVEVVDSHLPIPVEALFTQTRRKLTTILDGTLVYKVCSAVSDALQKELKKRPNRCLLTLKQVTEICSSGHLVRQLQKLGRQDSADQKDQKKSFGAGLNIVLKYLNDVGDIIFLEERLNFIVVDVAWFGREVLGRLIDPFEGNLANSGTGRLGRLGCLKKAPSEVAEETPQLRDENGFVRKSLLNRFLESSLRKIPVKAADLSGSLVDLMVQLDLCFEELHGDGGDSSSDPRFFFPAILDSSRYHGQPSLSGALEWTSKFPDGEETYLGRRLQCSDERTFLTPGFFPRLQVVLVKYFRDKKWLTKEQFNVRRHIIHFAHDCMEIFVEYSDADFFVDVLVKSMKGFKTTKRFIEDHILNQILTFCSSPRGCQGVDLVEAVIREPCVKRLSPLKTRRKQAVEVPFLQSQDDGFVYTWPPIEMPGTSDFTPAAELLYGPTKVPSQGDLAQKPKLSEIPTNIYFTGDDVENIAQLRAKLKTAKTIPLKLHIRCDGIDSLDPHNVDGQPGRVLYLRENFDSRDVPIVRSALKGLLEGGRIAAGWFNVQTPLAIEEFTKNPPQTQVLDIDLKELSELEDIEGIASLEVISKALKKYFNLHKESVYWELIFKNDSNFHRDFKLKQWVNPSTNEVSWLCKKCRKEDYRR